MFIIHISLEGCLTTQPVRNVIKKQLQSTNYFKVKPYVDGQKHSERIGKDIDEKYISAQQLQVKSTNQQTSKHEKYVEKPILVVFFIADLKTILLLLYQDIRGRFILSDSQLFESRYCKMQLLLRLRC